MKQKSTLSHFSGSLTSLALGVAAGYMIGGPVGAWLVFVLSVLETSLSFDNAVVNAKVLNTWDKKWHWLFIWIGLPIAVFGMRLVFPLLIVSQTTGLGMVQVFDMALTSPDQYAAYLTGAHAQVAAFGGVFLLLVAFEFFIDAEKEHHWIPVIEPLLVKLGTYQKEVGAAIVLGSLIGVSTFIGAEERFEFVMAGVYGFLTYVATKFVGALFAGDDAKSGKKLTSFGALMGSLMYLEILDASFSFDGVIGAFAITNQLFIIMIGLGVGAMFVRSMTIYLVEKGTLAEYVHLEHGAFWAIAALGFIMLASVFVHIPEAVSGFIGVGLVGAAVATSIASNKKKVAEAAEGAAA